MKNKLKYLATIIMVIIILSACGPTPAPSMSAADIQGTAVAAAWTIVAMTQAAIPTATPIPPTETPSPTALPTFTPLPLPTSAFPTLPVIGAPTSIPAGGATADPCNQYLAPNAPGHYVKVRFNNHTTGPVILSLALKEKTVFGECGYRGFNFGSGESPVLSILEGCYWAQAYITGKKPSTAVGEFCVRADGHKWEVQLRADSISMPDK
ncbi:MAG: hypothetical protein MUO77_18380 [Anaerolineales bacterium]|nr:hypothetical protein [Anaerolineales bacterium]